MQNHPQQDPTLPQGFTVTFRERFWKKVDKNGPAPQHRPELGQCWIWNGSKNDSGYGQMQRGIRGAGLVRATQASKLINGEQLPSGHIYLHKCDNPSCVNPTHLIAGTHADNVRDKISKGRIGWGVSVGESHPNSKLCRESIETIKHSGLSSKALALMFGVNPSTINRIKNGTSWASGYGGVITLTGVS